MVCRVCKWPRNKFPSCLRLAGSRECLPGFAIAKHELTNGSELHILPQREAQHLDHLCSLRLRLLYSLYLGRVVILDWSGYFCLRGGQYRCNDDWWNHSPPTCSPSPTELHQEWPSGAQTSSFTPLKKWVRRRSKLFSHLRPDLHDRVLIWSLEPHSWRYSQSHHVQSTFLESWIARRR